MCSDKNVRVSVIVYYKEIKRELKRITEGSTRLTYTGLCPLCERNEGGLSGTPKDRDGVNRREVYECDVFFVYYNGEYER